MHRVERVLSHLTPARHACPPSSIACECAGSGGSSTGASSPVATADLCDSHTDVACLPVQWKRVGRVTSFHGPAVTLKVFEDNALVRSTLEQAGTGRVLIVDGGGSLRCALVGDQLAALAVKNGWAGIIVHGAIRDSSVIDEMSIGVFSLGTCPVKSIKRGWGLAGPELLIGGQKVKPNDYVYADADGVLIAQKKLH